MSNSLEPFPTDDYVLDLVLESLNSKIDFDEDGEPIRIGSEFSLSNLIDFFSGYGDFETETLTYRHDMYKGKIYSLDNIIESLIYEIKFLRRQLELIEPDQER